METPAIEGLMTRGRIRKLQGEVQQEFALPKGQGGYLKICKTMSTPMHPTSILSLDQIDKKVDQTSYRGTTNLGLCYKKSDRYKLKGYNDDTTIHTSLDAMTPGFYANLEDHLMSKLIEGSSTLRIQHFTPLSLLIKPTTQFFSSSKNGRLLELQKFVYCVHRETHCPKDIFNIHSETHCPKDIFSVHSETHCPKDIFNVHSETQCPKT
ncbi:hypothetical protein CR513_37844, partial [Mucuna pruriens]